MNSLGGRVIHSMLWSVLTSTELGRRGCRLAPLFALALLTLPLAGCDSLGSITSFWNTDEPVLDEPAEKLYNEGLYNLNEKGDLKTAAKRFEEVDRQHPYSEWARKSLIMSAFAYYQSKQYEECVTAAKRYVSLHPGSGDAAYAEYLIGSSYFDQIPDITRDQART